VRDRVEADVVVVGGGGSGLAAAIEAASMGCEVVLLEKGARLGGSTRRSVGSISANRTEHQRRAGIEDSPQEHFEDMGKLAADVEGVDNLELRRIYVDEISTTFRWLQDAGIKFFGPTEEKPHRYPRMHNVLPNSGAYISRLSAVAERLGVHILTGSSVKSLVSDGGRVVGVTAASADGSTGSYVARRGVVLATGDFSASHDLKREYVGELEAEMDPVSPTSTGDGHQLGIAAGGRVVNGHLIAAGRVRLAPPRRMLVDYLPGWRVVGSAADVALRRMPDRLMRGLIMKFLTTYLAITPRLLEEGGVLVNRAGELVDTAGPLDAAIARQPGREAFIVFDDEVASKFESWPNVVSSAPGFAYAYMSDYRRHRKDVLRSSRRSWADLGRRIGVDPHRLTETMAAHGSTGDHQRTSRFFALGPMRAWIVVTDGGLAVTTLMEVLSDSGPIAGLFAAGSTGQGGVLLEGHGHHIGWAMVSGRRAGRYAARSEPFKEKSD
jgi:succinate dehydrogenase/fumarate reductase flavoprotein subunit